MEIERSFWEQTTGVVLIVNKKVLIINTGGTLSSVAKEHGLTPGLTTDSMLRELHVVAGEAELITQEFSSLEATPLFCCFYAVVLPFQRRCFDSPASHPAGGIVSDFLVQRYGTGGLPL